jgi:hypothetical protein
MGLTNYSLKKAVTPDPSPEPSPDLSPTGGDGGDEEMSNSLDKLVQAIYNSVTFAQRKVETEHMKMVMSTYFDDDGNARTFRVQLPTNGGEINTVDIPQITLTNNSHLAIDEIEMKLAVNLSHFADEINNENNKLCAKMVGTRGQDNLTKIKIKMKGVDTPEGIATINDQLIKILPN